MPLVNPSTLFPGMTADASSITIPFSALGGLTAAEANPASGNGMKILFELLTAAENRHSALAAAARSGRVVLTKTRRLTGDVVTDAFATSFTLAPLTNLDVAEEV